MKACQVMTGAIALALACTSAPAFADNDKIPPGDPCGEGNGQGTGNPCDGNNGNDGSNGNSGHHRHGGGTTPVVINLAMPPVSGRGAYVEQIGDSNRAGIAQSAANAYAHARQQGSRNEIDIHQKGNARSYLDALQDGYRNRATMVQGGTGQNVTYLVQDGDRNLANLNQSSGSGLFSGAVMTQMGNDNQMNLTQNGSDNRAKLTQDGNANTMTASQQGNGNRLIWSQEGNNLSHVAITQSGAGSLQINQSKGK
jgi:hypothetical protein